MLHGIKIILYFLSYWLAVVWNYSKNYTEYLLSRLAIFFSTRLPRLVLMKYVFGFIPTPCWNISTLSSSDSCKVKFFSYQDRWMARPNHLTSEITKLTSRVFFIVGVSEVWRRHSWKFSTSWSRSSLEQHCPWCIQWQVSWTLNGQRRPKHLVPIVYMCVVSHEAELEIFW